MLTTPLGRESQSKEKDDEKDGTKTPPKVRPDKNGGGVSNLTRTPTPFKNALAEMGKRRSEL